MIFFNNHFIFILAAALLASRNYVFKGVRKVGNSIKPNQNGELNRLSSYQNLKLLMKKTFLLCILGYKNSSEATLW